MCGVLMPEDKLAANIVDDWCLIKQNPLLERTKSQQLPTVAFHLASNAAQKKKTAPDASAVFLSFVGANRTHRARFMSILFQRDRTRPSVGSDLLTSFPQ
jgi:hypothetical protein